MFRPNGNFESTPPVAPAPLFADVFALPPPRSLPPMVTRRFRGKGRGLAFFFLLFGGIFFLVGFPLSLVFFPWHFRDSLALSSGNSATAPGRITSVTDISYNVNGRRVHQFFYAFEVDGQKENGRCYFPGGNYAEGCPVQVRYLKSRPALNCVAGGTFDPAGNFTIFVAIFPLLGAGFFCYGLWAAIVGVRRSLELARDGFLAEGRVTAVEQTSVRVNHQYRYRVVVDYDALGPQQMSYSAYGFDVDRARRWMESTAVVRVLYDRRRPERALVLDHFLG